MFEGAGGGELEAYTHPGVAEVGRKEAASRASSTEDRSTTTSTLHQYLTPKCDNMSTVTSPAVLNCKEESAVDTQIWKEARRISSQQHYVVKCVIDI